MFQHIAVSYKSIVSRGSQHRSPYLTVDTRIRLLSVANISKTGLPIITFFWLIFTHIDPKMK